MAKKPIVSIFKSNLDCNPLKTIADKPKGALMIWGIDPNPSNSYDFQHYLNYIRKAMDDMESFT